MYIFFDKNARKTADNLKMGCVSNSDSAAPRQKQDPKYRGSKAVSTDRPVKQAHRDQVRDSQTRNYGQAVGGQDQSDQGTNAKLRRYLKFSRTLVKSPKANKNRCTLDKSQKSAYGYGYAIIDTPLIDGVHEWKVRLDEGDVFEIGVFRTYVEHRWGWCTKCGELIPSDKSYPKARQGDTVAARVAFNQGKGQLTFYKNGNCLGTAFTDIPTDVLPYVRLNCCNKGKATLLN